MRVPALMALLVSGLLVGGEADAASSTYRFTRVVAARGVKDMQPVGSATQFSADVGRIVLWFEGPPAPRDLTVQADWSVDGVRMPDASDQIALTKGSTGGYFSLALPAGETAFPSGVWRVTLAAEGQVLATHRFTVTEARAAMAPPRPSRPTPSPTTERPTGAARSAPRLPVPAGFDRAAVLERMLPPRPAPAGPSAAGAPAKEEKKRAEAAEAYQRGLVFFRQGAYAEAQKAFHEAEKKDGTNLEYAFATAYSCLKLHKPEDALKRYEKAYKQDPTNRRSLLGMAFAYEEALNYREAVKLWQRYARTDLPRAEKREAEALLRGAQELFAERYEIAENPAGGAANLVTPQEELALGRQFAGELAATGVPLLQDVEIVRYVEGLCQTLVPHAKQFPTNYQVFVLDTANVNAMTVPGFIFVYRGILEAADDESQLAGVLAHEIGHSVGHHAAKKVSKTYQDQQTLENLKKQDSKLARFLAKLVESGNPLGALSFSREQEAQADRLAVHIVFDAGYDPRGLVGFFLHLESIDPSSRKAWDLMKRTHPFEVDRMNTVTEYAALLPERSLRRNSPAFERVKARLRRLQPAPDATGMMISTAGR